MNQEKKENKSRKLRPVKVFIAILAVVLFVIVLDRLPTSRSARNDKIVQGNAGEPVPEGKEYYYLQGFLDILENEIIDRLKELGVPEEDYENVVEYLSKDELAMFEAKIKLASSLEGTYVEVEETDKRTLEKVLKLDSDYSFERFQKSEVIPSEYVILKDLLKEYEDSISKIDEEE